MIKNILKMSVASVALLVAANGVALHANSTEVASAKTVMVAEKTPELGKWGVDLTARKASIKPGDDFFRYANGSWLDTFELPADRTNYGAFTVLGERSRDQTKAIIDELKEGTFADGTVEQKISDYYNSYMDVDAINAAGIDPIRPMLAEVAAVKNIADLTVLFGRTLKDNFASPITAGLGINRKDPNRYQLGLGIGGMSLPDRDYYLEDTENFIKIRAEYVTYVAKMLGYAGVDGADEKAKAILAIETKIAEIQWPRAERRNRDKTFNPMSYTDFKAEYKGFDWDSFFSAGDLTTINDLNVTFPSSVAAAVGLVNSISVDDWKAFLAYRVVSNHAGILTEEIDATTFAFFGTTLNGQPQQRDRWKRAVGRVGGLNALGEAIGQVYVKRHFPESSKVQMDQLVVNLRAAMAIRINGLEWMGEETKIQAHKKLNSFNPKIGYPKKWKDLSKMEIKAGALFANVKSINAFNYAITIARFARETDKDEWFMTPQTVNAYYNSSFNEIVFPAAILQPPFFDPNADIAVNYGGIGAVIGHEMGHGFDDQGSKSDYRGIQENWWTDTDRKNFDAKTSALASQYDKFEAVKDNFVDGNFTLGENIGDVGGLAMAYHAYKLALGGKEAPVIDGLTGDQRFFLAWAQVWKRKYREAALIARLKSDPHSPSEFRVNGVVRNMDEWYAAFNVKEGDALYLAPEDRIQIW